MKIAVIHGSPRKGSTYYCAEIMKQTMQGIGEVSFEEIYLPQDAPCFCKGCFTCFAKGEEHCPNANYIQPIAKKLEEADGWIVTTPVYAMQISGALKALLDHHAYNFLNHRPRFFYQKSVHCIHDCRRRGSKLYQIFKREFYLLGCQSYRLLWYCYLF